MGNTVNVKFIITDEDNKEVVVTAKEGEHLLEVAHDNNLELQHNCGGVCGCSTCHVYIEEGAEGLPEMSEAEEDRVDLAEDPKLNSRLACQCEIGPNTGDIVVTIPPQDFLGH